MARLKKTMRGVLYIEGVHKENIIAITNNSSPMCDNCFYNLTNSVIIVPLADEVYCSWCAKGMLRGMTVNRDDAFFQEERARYYMNLLNRR